jgi:hypothetical protein
MDNQKSILFPIKVHTISILWISKIFSSAGVWNLLLTPQFLFIQIMAKFEMQPLYVFLFDYTYARIRIVHDKSQRVNVP